MGSCQVMAKDLVRTRRYIQKFYQMKTQLQAVSLRIQTVGTNQQMMMSMKGATQLLGSMNRSMNLPSLQKIAMEFEKENDIMDQRQEMMDDAIDDSMEADEDESEEIVNQVFDEIGIDLNQAVSFFFVFFFCLFGSWFLVFGFDSALTFFCSSEIPHLPLRVQPTRNSALLKL